METQFALDMRETSDQVVTLLAAGDREAAVKKINWMWDHSAATDERDALFRQLARDWGALVSNADDSEIRPRITALLDAVIRAGPSPLDRALLRY